jgi:signal transduction histidine kinase
VLSSASVLHDFVLANRAEIIARCRAMIADRPAPRPTDVELEYGVPLFLDQLVGALRHALEPDPQPDAAIRDSAVRHGNELLHGGFTIAQVVRDYGGICQAITEMAVERAESITAREFQTLNLCLDDGIAAAVTEFGRLREHEGSARASHLAHELRNKMNTALLAFETLKAGTVGVAGSTGRVLERSLAGMRSLLDRELIEVRLGAELHHFEPIVVRELLEDVEVAAAMDAVARGLRFSVAPTPSELMVSGDREILASVVSNLLQNALKFSRAGGQVSLRATGTADRVFIEVEDECGGLPPGKVDALFQPFSQHSADRSGLGLGLGICRRGARINSGEIRVVNRPGSGCVFTVDLPRQPAQARAQGPLTPGRQDMGIDVAHLP